MAQSMESASPAKKSKVSGVRTHNARLAIAILENRLKGGCLAAAQNAAIAILRSVEPVAETVSLVRFHKPGKSILKKARGAGKKCNGNGERTLPACGGRHPAGHALMRLRGWKRELSDRLHFGNCLVHSNVLYSGVSFVFTNALARSVSIGRIS
jgi:hypothetical protein